MKEKENVTANHKAQLAARRMRGRLLELKSSATAFKLSLAAMKDEVEAFPKIATRVAAEFHEWIAYGGPSALAEGRGTTATSKGTTEGRRIPYQLMTSNTALANALRRTSATNKTVIAGVGETSASPATDGPDGPMLASVPSPLSFDHHLERLFQTVSKASLTERTRDYLQSSVGYVAELVLNPAGVRHRSALEGGATVDEDVSYTVDASAATASYRASLDHLNKLQRDLGELQLYALSCAEIQSLRRRASEALEARSRAALFDAGELLSGVVFLSRQTNNAAGTTTNANSSGEKAEEEKRRVKMGVPPLEQCWAHAEYLVQQLPKDPWRQSAGEHPPLPPSSIAGTAAAGGSAAATAEGENTPTPAVPPVVKADDELAELITPSPQLSGMIVDCQQLLHQWVSLLQKAVEAHHLPKEDEQNDGAHVPDWQHQAEQLVIQSLGDIDPTVRKMAALERQYFARGTPLFSQSREIIHDLQNVGSLWVTHRARVLDEVNGRRIRELVECAANIRMSDSTRTDRLHVAIRRLSQLYETYLRATSQGGEERQGGEEEGLQPSPSSASMLSVSTGTGGPQQHRPSVDEQLSSLRGKPSFTLHPKYGTPSGLPPPPTGSTRELSLVERGALSFDLSAAEELRALEGMDMERNNTGGAPTATGKLAPLADSRGKSHQSPTHQRTEFADMLLKSYLRRTKHRRSPSSMVAPSQFTHQSQPQDAVGDEDFRRYPLVHRHHQRAGTPGGPATGGHGHVGVLLDTSSVGRSRLATRGTQTPAAPSALSEELEALRTFASEMEDTLLALTQRRDEHAGMDAASTANIIVGCPTAASKATGGDMRTPLQIYQLSADVQKVMIRLASVSPRTPPRYGGTDAGAGVYYRYEGERGVGGLEREANALATLQRPHTVQGDRMDQRTTNGGGGGGMHIHTDGLRPVMTPTQGTRVKGPSPATTKHRVVLSQYLKTSDGSTGTGTTVGIGQVKASPVGPLLKRRTHSANTAAKVKDSGLVPPFRNRRH